MSIIVSDFPRSIFFETCRGVFQGGGCRVAAHIGAYQVAHACGVTFSAVAGTSGGSIVAALIGAGAKPEQLVDIVSALDFKRFLGDPTEQDGYKSAIARFGARLVGRVFFLNQNVRALRDIFLFGGMHSAAPLEQWLDAALRKILDIHSRPVHFQDLVLPTSVVATDLSTNSVRVWSKRTTPNESVAYAVRCSCSIPFFYQSAMQGNSRLVDGGILSNLPTFVFNERDADSEIKQGNSPILAFRLKEEFSPPKAWNPSSTARRMIDSVIDGATDVQLLLNRRVHTVSISTPGVSATDFDSMNAEMSKQLISHGRYAALHFFQNERARWKSIEQRCVVCHDEYETLSSVTLESKFPSDRIDIFAPDSGWFWKLFPTVLRWLRDGTRVVATLPSIGGSSDQQRKEGARRDSIRQMGIAIAEIDDLPLWAFLFRRRDPTRAAAVVLQVGRSEYEPHAVHYEGPTHKPLLEALEMRIDSLLAQIDTSGVMAAPTLASFSESKIFDLLRDGVSQYSNSDVKFEMLEVETDRIDLVVSQLRAYKYQQVQEMLNLYDIAGMQRFESARLQFGEQFAGIVTPPVLEMNGSRFVAIEGNTRLYRCYRQGVSKVLAIVVSNVPEPLPGKPVPLHRVAVSTGFVPVGERIEGFSYGRFRRIEGAIHQPGASA